MSYNDWDDAVDEYNPEWDEEEYYEDDEEYAPAKPANKAPAKPANNQKAAPSKSTPAQAKPSNAPKSNNNNKKQSNQPTTTNTNSESSNSSSSNLSRDNLRELEEARDMALANDLFGTVQINTKNSTSNLPGSENLNKEKADTASTAPASSSPSSSSSSSTPAAASNNNNTAASSASAMQVEFTPTTSDAQLDAVSVELAKRCEKLGKSALGSRKVLRLIKSLLDETIKLNLLKNDECNELKVHVTTAYNSMNNKNKAKAAPSAASKAPASKASKPAANPYHRDDDLDNSSQGQFDDFM